MEKAKSPEEIYEQFARLINEQNYLEIAGLFSERGRIIPPHNQPDTAAKDAINNYQFIFRRHEAYTVKYKINEVVLNGADHAAVRYSWTGDGDMGKYTYDGEDEVSRQPDGTWLIDLNHAFAAGRYTESGKPIDFE